MCISISIYDLTHISLLSVFLIVRIPIYPYSYLAAFLSIHILIYHIRISYSYLEQPISITIITDITAPQVLRLIQLNC